MNKQANRPNLKQMMQKLAANFEMPGLNEWAESIEDPLDYEDPNERQAVINRNMDMLHQKISLLQHFSRIDPAQAQQFTDNAGNFEYGEWQELQGLKQDLKEYEQAINENTQTANMQSVVEAGRKESEVAKKKKSKRKIGSPRGWIAS
jgi:hypothetical protein